MNEYGMWMSRYVDRGDCCQSKHRDVIKVNLDEGETQIIEVDGEHRIVIRKDDMGNTIFKTQHKEVRWVDDDPEPEYGLQA